MQVLLFCKRLEVRHVSPSKDLFTNLINSKTMRNRRSAAVGGPPNLKRSGEMAREHFCTQCNTKTELKEIEDMAGETMVCMNCSRIESGYTEDWRPFVTALQTVLPTKNYFMIGTILAIAKECAPKFKEE